MNQKKFFFILIGILIVGALIYGSSYFLGKKKPEILKPPEIKKPSAEKEEVPPEELTPPEAEEIEKILEKREYTISEKKETEIFEKKEGKLPLLEGKIYLTLAKAGGEKAIYSFNTKTEKLEKIDLKEGIEFNIRFSKEGKKAVFLALDEENLPQVFLKEDEKIKQITFEKEKGKIFPPPAISPDGKKIAFTKVVGFEGEEPIEPLVESPSETYLINLETQEKKFISEGMFPTFSPDGRYLVLLRNVGVYLFDLEKDLEKESSRIRAIELKNEKGELIAGTILMKMSLSPNGKLLYWSNPEREEIYILEITSWEPFRTKIQAILRGKKCFWGAFSPDENYFACQKGEFDKQGLLINPKLAIYDTLEFKERLSYDLKDFAGGEMWITDWQK